MNPVLQTHWPEPERLPPPSHVPPMEEHVAQAAHEGPKLAGWHCEQSPPVKPGLQTHVPSPLCEPLPLQVPPTASQVAHAAQRLPHCKGARTREESGERVRNGIGS